MTSRRVPRLGATWVALTLALAGCSPEASLPSPPPPPAPVPTVHSAAPPELPPELAGEMRDYVTTVSKLRVFFGHQALGYAVMRGINRLSRLYGRGGPQYVSLDKKETLPSRPSDGLIAHTRIGAARDPLTTIKGFSTSVRRFGQRTFDVAMVHLSPPAVTAGTDVDAVFKRYRSVLRDLEKELPGLAFVHATVPLEVGAATDNANRTRYNELLRAEYGVRGILWDIAMAESTDPSGNQIGGPDYQSLYPGYANGTGDLNELGSTRVAGEWFRAVAYAWTRR